MRSRIYTLRGCTIEVPKGGQSATATLPGKEPVEFTNIAGGPSGEVQAQRLAMDLPAWKPSKGLTISHTGIHPIKIVANKPPVEPPKDVK